MRELVIQNGGVQYAPPAAELCVHCGTASSGIVVSSGEYLYVSSGETLSGAVVDGGYLYVSSGGTADHTTFNWGIINVYSGGTADYTMGGPLTLQGGSLTLQGGTADHTVLHSGCFLDIYSGGTADHTTVNSCGCLAVCSGGTANNTELNFGGYLNVIRGTVNHVTVNSSADVTITSGGEANHVSLCHSGRMYVYSGGANHVSLSGEMYVYSGGSASQVTVLSGGWVEVSSGGKVSDIIIESGGSGGFYRGAVLSGKLQVEGVIVFEDAALTSGFSDLSVNLGFCSDLASLIIVDGQIPSSVSLSVDTSLAYGTYQLVRGGADQMQSITVINDGVSSQLAVGSTFSVTADKTLQLTREDSNLYLKVDVADTTPPALPGNIHSVLAENHLSLSWDEVTDQTGVTYEIEYSKDPAFAGSVLSEKFLVNEAEFALGNGIWYWRLRAVDGAGNSSNWSTVSSVSVDHTDVVEGRFTETQTFCGDVVVKASADGECSYPACVQILSPECTVTVEGGSLSADSIRNAVILFGDDAYWTNYFDYGDHYDGTVVFTGASAALESKVSYCITAAGIVGKNLTVNFSGAADRSAGITFHAGQGDGAGNEAAAILADEDLVINGSFGGTAVSWFDFSTLSSERWAYAEGFASGGSLTVNGDICGTILSFAYASSESANGYGLKAGYDQGLTVNGVISGTVAAFGTTEEVYALSGDWIDAEISGVLIAGTAEAGTAEADHLAMIRNPGANREKLTALASDHSAVYAYGFGDSTVTVRSTAEIFGGIRISGALNVSSGAFISGYVESTSLNITLDAFASEPVFAQGWYQYTSTEILADSAKDGTYQIAGNLNAGGWGVAVSCGTETKLWNWTDGETIQFSGGRSLTFSYANGDLSLTASGFGAAPADREAPDVSGISMSISVDGDQALAVWTPASDNTGVTAYRLQYALTDDPGTVTEITVSGEQTLLDQLQNGTYFIQLQAGDAAGNWSAWTEKEYFTVEVQSSVVTLPYELPQAEYMYGCVPTSVAMILGYYDLYGYNGYDASDLIPGTISVYSRGTDGNAHNMNAFDTVLGNFTASQEYVARFYGTSKETELPETFVAGDPEQGLNTSVFNCLADWLGTGQYWRDNEDLSTSEYYLALEELYDSSATQKIDTLNVPISYVDYKYGLDCYLQSVGYRLNAEKTATILADAAGGTFTFEDYMAEIDAGRPVILSICTDSGSGHAMTGYGYDIENREILFDDTYSANGKMAWDGTYSFAGDTYHLQSVTTIVLDESTMTRIPLPSELQGDPDGLRWQGADGVPYYVVEYSQDDFVHTLSLQVRASELDSFALPSGTWQWRVRSGNSVQWVEGSAISCESSPEIRILQSDADQVSDVFFASSDGAWSRGYAAQHVGFAGAWDGTQERVMLAGKNRITDVFKGSSDANILLLTDDENGDALFVEDLYSASPADPQARLAQLDEIRAGAGNDIVDMTSQQFAYAGDGVTVRGGAGDDTVWANQGNNQLFGDAGDDRLVGASGNDVIAGGTGNDSMHGGGGEDLFCFCDNWGTDTVEQLSGSAVTLWFQSDSGTWDPDTLTYSDGTNRVTVTGVGIAQVKLKFGDDASAQYGELKAAGAFTGASSERIFGKKETGVLAGL